MSQTGSVSTEEISGVDELQRKADQLRDDGLFNVKVVNWEKSGDNSVEVQFRVPSGSTERVKMDWPDKPTEESEFIQFCMSALNLDDPVDASMMAENLKSPVEQDYVVRADVQDGDWDLIPEKESPSASSEYVNSLDVLTFAFSILGGPFTLGLLAVVGVMGEPGLWFSRGRFSNQMYWFAQSLFYGCLGSLIWVFVFFLISG